MPADVVPVGRVLAEQFPVEIGLDAVAADADHGPVVAVVFQRQGHDGGIPVLAPDALDLAQPRGAIDPAAHRQGAIGAADWKGDGEILVAGGANEVDAQVIFRRRGVREGHSGVRFGVGHQDAVVKVKLIHAGRFLIDEFQDLNDLCRRRGGRVGRLLAVSMQSGFFRDLGESLPR